MGPYSGKRVPSDGILYPRYTTVEEILGPTSNSEPKAKTAKINAGAAPSTPTPADGSVATPLSGAQSQSAASLYQIAAMAAAAGADPETVATLQRQAAKRAKRESRVRNPADPQEDIPMQQPHQQPVQQVQQPVFTQPQPVVQQYQQPAVLASAPVESAKRKRAGADNNADEAARIRAALGYTAPAPAAPVARQPAAPVYQQPVYQQTAAPIVQQPVAPAAAPVAAAKPAGGVFGFGFSVAKQVEDETESKIARIMAKDATKDGFVPRRVWVCGLPHEFTEDQIKEYWGYCGPVESLDLLTFKDSGRFNGAAFVTFQTQEGYEAALATNGEELEGRKIRVEKCRVPAPKKGAPVSVTTAAAPAYAVPSPAPVYIAPTPAPTPTPAPAPAPTPAPSATHAVAAAPAPDEEISNVAYVGNIAFEATEDDLKRLFSAYNVQLIRLHTDQKTGKPKGFAHVHFSDGATMTKALAVDGAELHGRNLKVLPGQPKKKK